MDVIELRRVDALGIPAIQQLLKRAVESGAFLAPGGFDTVAPDIFEFVKNPQMFMLLGAEKGEFRSVLLGYYPHGNLFPYPTIVLFYNEGSRELSRLTQDKALEIITEAGYTRMLAVNSTGRDDEVWQRALTPEGTVSRKAGTLMMFEIE